MGVEISRLSQRRGRWRHHRSPFISRFPGLRLIQQPGAGRALNSRFLVAENPRADLLLCAKHLLVAAIGRRRAHHAAPRPRRPAGAGSPPPRWWEPLPRLLPGRAKLRSVGTPGASFPEAWVGKRWRPIAQSDYEASARRLFNQASYVCPVETLLRLRRGSDVLIKMPADGRGNVRE